MMKTEQQRLYAAMPAEARCFVRVCQSDDALWVSDLPRRFERWQEIVPELEMRGYSCWEADGLLYIDLSWERWARWLESCPEACPPMPSQEAHHPLYALCRLYLAHEGEDMPSLRRVAKALNDETALLRAVPALHQTAAAQLRNGQPVSHAAGRMLAEWLCKQKEEY